MLHGWIPGMLEVSDLDRVFELESSGFQIRNLGKLSYISLVRSIRYLTSVKIRNTKYSQACATSVISEANCSNFFSG